MPISTGIISENIIYGILLVKILSLMALETYAFDGISS